MVGQGRPPVGRGPRIDFAGRAPCRLRATLWLLVLCACAMLGESAAAQDTMRLRIAFGGGEERLWQGAISVSGGTLGDIRPLGIEADEPASVWLDEGRVRIRHFSPRGYEGLDVSVTAPLDSTLTVDLATRGVRPDTKQVEVKLTDLLAGEQATELDDRGNWLLIQRAPGDALRVRTHTDSLVFWAGEKLPIDVAPHLTSAPAGSELRITAELRRARGDQSLWQDERSVKLPAGEGAAPHVSFDPKLPEGEGVYDLVLVASRRTTFRIWQTVAERKVQLVVLGREAPDPTHGGRATPPTKVITEIDPTSSSWLDRLAKLPQISLVPALAKEPLAYGPSSVIDHPTLGKLVQLAPPAGAKGLSWKAYPLPLDSVGQPHVLEVDYPSDARQSMGVSILEPNAAGELKPIGLDTSLQAAPSAGEARLLTHRVIFWPRTKSPLVLVTNQSDSLPAAFGTLRVRGPQPPAGTFRIDKSALGHLPRAFPAGSSTGERLLAAYLEKPLLVENFSATGAIDPASERSLTDWQSFHEASGRLVEYLHHVGYNGLLLAVLADGATIYPSSVLHSTPRFDTGAFYGTGQDPRQKDVLELLLRQFDRQGLVLIPTLQFTTPLPELEAILRRDGPPTVGLEPVDGTGATWYRKHAAVQGRSAYYNPLDPRVQAAMERVVVELLSRYGHHRALGGVAIELAADGYTQLPGEQWGLDDATFARFERDASVALDDDGPHRFAVRQRYVAAEPGRGLWLAWRARQLHAFHVRLHPRLAAIRPHAKLYLAGTSLLETPDIQAQLAPLLPPRETPPDLLLQAGIDPQLYRQQTDIVLMRPQRIVSGRSDIAQAAIERQNQSAAIDRQLSALEIPGSLIGYEPQRIRLESFDKRSPFGAEKTFSYLVSQPLPSGQESRRHLVHALASLDAVALVHGGWLLPQGSESWWKEFIAVYRSLPATRFETLPLETQPVTIRTYRGRGRTYVYLVNDSPWSVQASVDIDAQTLPALTPLGGRQLPPLVATGRGGRWTVDLEPYDVVAAVFADENVSLVAPQIRVAEDVEQQLAEQINAIVQRFDQLRGPVPVRLAFNPSFEEADSAGQPGDWYTFQADGAELKRIDRQPHEGRYAARLNSAGAGATLVSRPFDVPQSGQLWLSVWLRIDEGTKAPDLRLGLEGRFADQHYHRFAELAADAGVKPLGPQWGQYVLKLDDIPEGGRRDMRVRLDLGGSGAVDIDHVQLIYVLDTAQQVALRKIAFVASQDRLAGRLTDCARGLDDYWPRLVFSMVRPPERPLVLRERAGSDPEPEQESHSLLDRAKGLVPKFLR